MRSATFLVMSQCSAAALHGPCTPAVAPKLYYHSPLPLFWPLNEGAGAAPLTPTADLTLSSPSSSSSELDVSTLAFLCFCSAQRDRREGDGNKACESLTTVATDEMGGPQRPKNKYLLPDMLRTRRVARWKAGGERKRSRTLSPHRRALALQASRTNKTGIFGGLWYPYSCIYVREVAEYVGIG